VNLVVNNKRKKSVDTELIIISVLENMEKEAYNIIIERNKGEFIQLFKERGHLSLVYSTARRIYTKYSIDDNRDEILELINKYVNGNKLKLSWDEISNKMTAKRKNKYSQITVIAMLIESTLIFLYYKYFSVVLPEGLVWIMVTLSGMTMTMLGHLSEENERTRALFYVGPVIFIFGILKVAL
jgi:septum formation topological specificity factor MinE